MAKNTVRRETGVYRRDGILTYSWQLKVPKDLRHLYSTQWAEQCSLRTSSLPEANKKARELRVKWDATFEQQRKQLNPKTVERITAPMAQFLADTALSGIMESNQAFRSSPADQDQLLEWMRAMGVPGADAAQNLLAWTQATPGGYSTTDRLGGMPPALAEALAKLHEQLDEQIGRALATGNLRQVLPGMQLVGQRIGLFFDENTPGVVEALAEYLKAIKTATAGKVRRDRGEVVHTPSPPSLNKIEAQTTRHLRDVFDRWKGKKKRSKDSLQAMERALKQFEQQTGNPPLTGITRDMGDAFAAWLQTLDLASKTAHDRITAVKTLLKYAHQDLEWLQRHPWAGIDIEHQTENPRFPWTDEELKAFFGLPLFQRYELPEAGHWKNGKDAAYWVPILGLYTGARVGELAQLRVQDVKPTYAGPFLSITDEAEGATVKTAAGIRNVPVHPELVRLGFMEYVGAMKEAGAVSLWPSYKPLKDEPGTYFSGWVNPFHKEATGNADAPVFHELRHTVRTALHRRRVDLHAIDLIIGHENGTLSKVQKGYTRLTEEDLAAAIRKLDYPAVTLPAVYKARK